MGSDVKILINVYLLCVIYFPHGAAGVRGGNLSLSDAALDCPDPSLVSKTPSDWTIGNRKIPPRPLRNLRWLHIPKCGSTLGFVIRWYACTTTHNRRDAYPEPEIRNRLCNSIWNFGKNEQCLNSSDPVWTSDFHTGHSPLGKETKTSAVVAMFRHPASRTISGFYHALHDCSPMQHKYELYERNFTFYGDFKSMKKRDAQRYRKFYNDSSPGILQDYTECVSACSVNMINGKPCAGGNATEKDVANAVAKVSNFAFVGLTEEFDLSVCLFHAMFGGAPDRASFAKIRAAKHRGKIFALKDVNHRTILPDLAVYDQANRTFWERIDQYGITRTECNEMKAKTRSCECEKKSDKDAI